MEGPGPLESTFEQKGFAENVRYRKGTTHSSTTVASKCHTRRGGNESCWDETEFQFGNVVKCIVCGHPLQNYTSVDVKIQSKAREYHQKVQHCSDESLAPPSLQTLPRLGAERKRQGEGSWSRPSNTALERSDFT